MDITALALFLQTSVQMGTPILLGTLGGIMGEKAGNLNLGVEGLMLMGASMGFLTGLATGNPLLAVLAACAAGAFGGLLYAICTVTFRSNQVVTGLALTIFGTGFANFIGGMFLGGQALPDSVLKPLAAFDLPGLCKIPVLGDVFFKQSIFVYISLILAVLMYFYHAFTRIGLNTRMVGENPAAADASGIRVNLYKYVNLLIGGAIAGLGGAYLSLVFVPRWQDNITAGIGWIAVALVIFAKWRPVRAIFGAYFFGILRALGFKLQGVELSLFGSSLSFNAQFLDMIPYAATILVLVLITMRNRPEDQPPRSLSAPYFREER